MADVDLLVIGGGAIGLAVAREAAIAGFSVVLAETNYAIGMETSSRNSEVIHAGIYYAPGSLKARACVEGRDLLYAFADRYGVAHRRCGKLIVATGTGQEEALEAIRARATASGVEVLALLSRGELAAREPAVNGTAALFSPSTGIVDSHGFMLALAGHAEAAGATLAMHSRIRRIERRAGEWAVFVGEDAQAALTSRRIVNAAGLAAPDMAAQIDGYSSDRPAIREWAKGNYFSYAGAVPFTSLVYPVPVPGGLGIHLTLDLAGRARFGPNVEWIDRLDYAVDPLLRDEFAAAIASYWPGVDRDRLHPDYAGIRPKLGGREDPAGDFVIETSAIHGLPGVVNLLGIESPGLTASLALARMTVETLDA
ncbi:NAD(P)/FAD-dependent oxidoreductase [Tsuneonella sp. HG094]